MGLTLTEVVVALALISLVMIPAGAALHRLAALQKAVSDSASDYLRCRQHLEELALRIEQDSHNLPPRVINLPGVDGRVTYTLIPESSLAPATLEVRVFHGSNATRICQTKLLPSESRD